MTVQAAELKAPSGSLLTRWLTHPEFWQALLRDFQIQGKLQQLSSAIPKLARPLAYAKDAASLDRTLKEQLPAYLHWKGELYVFLMLNSIDPSGSTAFLAQYAKAKSETQEFFAKEAPLYLSEEDVERLLSAAYGASTYSETLLHTLLEERPQALDPETIQATIESFVKADLLLLTAVLILERRLRRWTLKRRLAPTLALITRKADELIDGIEDELLIRDPEFRRRMEQTSESAISLEECRKQLGLE